MSPADWQEVRRLHEEALRRPPSEREAWLRVAGASEEVTREVRALLSYDGSGDVALPWPLAKNVLSAGEAHLMDARIGAYRLVERIGEGASGTVYRAERADGLFSQTVAIKILRWPVMKRMESGWLQNECSLLARMDHPGIARLYNAGMGAAGPYLVMELVEGVPLDAAAGSADVQLQRLIDVCRAVQSAHSHLVVHGDLKPGNILVDGQGRIKLLDFGISSLVNQVAPEVLAGTPGWSSPEQLMGAAPSTASDVYSLGRLVARVCGTHGQFALVVERACRGRPAARYASAAHVAEDLDRIRRHIPIHGNRVAPVRRTALFFRRRWDAALLATVTLAVLVAGVLRISHERDAARQQADRVQSMAKMLIVDLHQEIRTVPGAIHTRKSMVDNALSYLDALAEPASLDTALFMDLATAYSLVAEIQGNPHYMNLGDLEGATKHYRQALQYRRAVWRADSMRADVRTAWASDLGNLAVMASWGGDNKEAIRLAQEAVAILERGTKSANAQAVEGRVRGELAWWLIWDGAGQDGLEEASRAVGLLEAYHRDHPEDDLAVLWLWRTYSYMADGLRFSGQWPDVLRLMQDAGIPLISRAMASWPAHPGLTYALHVAYDYVGMAHMQAGRLTLAEQAWARSLDEALVLQERDTGNQKAQEAVARAYIARAKVRVASGRTRAAVEDFARAAAMRSRMAAANPGNLDMGNMVGTAYLAACRSLIKIDDPGSARPWCLEGIEALERVAGQAWKSPIIVANLSALYGYMADVHAQLYLRESRSGHRAEALMWLERYESAITVIGETLSGYELEVSPDELKQRLADAL